MFSKLSLSASQTERGDGVGPVTLGFKILGLLCKAGRSSNLVPSDTVKGAGHFPVSQLAGFLHLHTLGQEFHMVYPRLLTELAADNAWP